MCKPCLARRPLHVQLPHDNTAARAVKAATVRGGYSWVRRNDECTSNIARMRIGLRSQLPARLQRMVGGAKPSIKQCRTTAADTQKVFQDATP